MNQFYIIKKLAVVLAIGTMALGGQVQAQEAQFVPGEVLVQFKPNAADAHIAEAFAQAGLEFKETIGREGAPNRSLVLAVTQMPVAEAVRVLARHPGVAFAEPNWVYTHHVANDPYYTGGNLWGMYGDATSPANVFGSQAGEAWAQGYTGSETVYLGVIDEGYEIGHPDLAANIGTNPGEIANNLIDDDGNGYVDDVYGWDFDGNDNTVYDGTGDDHGTHVAGTIGAKGNNQAGVVGVNWSVKMLNAKFLGSDGGTTANAIKAVDYFTDLKTRHNLNLVALNNSWGGGGYSQGLHDAIIRAAKAGILFMAASGNGDFRGRAINNDEKPQYPSSYDTSVGTSTETAAAYDAVVAVTAIDSNGEKAKWANYGATSVDLGAPGVSIWSTIPAGTYKAYSGTSMATPHVTAAAGLYASTHAGESAAAIKAALLNSTMPTSSLSGITVTGGRLDLSDVITPAVASPTVVISSPLEGATFDSGAQITFTGSATDVDGTTDLSGSLQWTSNIDGSIGTGGTFTRGLSDGSHTITASVVGSNGETGSSTVSIQVGAPPPAPQLSVQVSVDRDPPNYYHRETVVITVSVTDGTLPVSGAAVHVTIVTAKGNQLTGSGTSDSNGLVSFNYKVNSKSHGTGTYQITSDATKDGYLAGSGQTTFNVVN